MSTSPSVRCRLITDSDFEAVADLLVRGFPKRGREYWTRALNLLQRRRVPETCARYGYLLEVGKRPVGVHLLIFCSGAEQPGPGIRCHTSAWYVEPEYRSLGAMLASVATGLKYVTYLNSTADAQTWPMLEALGYRRYSEGQFVAIPALSLGRQLKVAQLLQSDAHQCLSDYDLLRSHADGGCLALICETRDGPKPFVFRRRHIRYAPIGVMQLVYCRDTVDLVICAGPIGRFLLQRGATCVICDADAALPGMIGKFFPGKNLKFFKGPHKPRLNDLAFSEEIVLEGAA